MYLYIIKNKQVIKKINKNTDSNKIIEVINLYKKYVWYINTTYIGLKL